MGLGHRKTRGNGRGPANLSTGAPAHQRTSAPAHLSYNPPMSQSRRDFLALSAVGVVAGAIGRPALARAWQQQQAPPQTSFNPIRNNVGYFLGGGGTIGYLINASGVAVVDTQFANTAKICLDGLNERSKNHGVDKIGRAHV